MLTLADREEISRGVVELLDYKDIAVRIGRDASVVSREVARHGGRDNYRAVAAEAEAVVGRSRPKGDGGRPVCADTDTGVFVVTSWLVTGLDRRPIGTRPPGRGLLPGES